MFSFFFTIVSLVIPFLRLVVRLFLDSRVPVFTKIIPFLAIVYLVSPYDIVADVIPILGQFDDLLVVGLLLFLFVLASPGHVVADQTIGRKFRDFRDRGRPRHRKNSQSRNTVETEFRYVDDDDEQEDQIHT